MGKLQKKTGAGRASIEKFFEQFTEKGGSKMSQAGEAVRDYAQQATEAVQGTSQQALDSAREGYAQAEDMVRQHPSESLAVCFGAGVLTGVVVGLLLRSR